MYQMKKGGSKPKMKKGGFFGMLSVKKGIDNNPASTQADRIAGATMKKGGSVKKMKMGGSCGTSKSMKKYAKGGNVNTSIVDRMKSEGMSSDMNSRKKLAESLGIKDYKGTAEQNMKMLKTVKSKYDPSEQAAKNPSVVAPSKPSIASRLRGDEYKKPATNTKEPAKTTKEPDKKYTSSVFKSRMKMGGSVKGKKK